MTLTLKNVPEGLHQRLEARASRHHRSVAEEALECMEKGMSEPEPQKQRPSLLQPPPPVSVGTILQPLGNRAEMLEGFMDRH